MLILNNTNAIDYGTIFVFVIPIAIFLFIVLPLIIIVKSIKRARREFVEEHSEALKTLHEINKKYKFYQIDKFDMEHSYDNENFYDDITCTDYLTYQLVYIKDKVEIALKNTLANKNRFEEYYAELKEKCSYGVFDAPYKEKDLGKFIDIEKEIFNKEMKNPRTSFFIDVYLELTNIQGRHKESKHKTFMPKEIKDIIFRLRNKRGAFYQDRDIWDSICRVERGKVSNKMRFAVMDRDHNRCRCCGSRYDLEIDHILPIAKGGESTFDNLQTLCHRCNVRKGTNMIRY